MSGLFGGGSPVNQPIVYSGLNVSTSQWNLPVAIFWGQRRLSPNAMDYDGFQKHEQSGKGGKGGSGKGGQYTYSADVLQGLCEGPIDSIANVWAAGSTTTTTSLSALNMTLFTGTIGQAPWSYWASKYPSKALGYSQTAYLGAVNLDLGSSSSIPDNAFECVRSMSFGYTHTTGGWINPTTHVQGSAIDVLLSDVIPDLLTNPQYGMGWSAGDIGSVAQFAAYQRAQGLFFSPLLNSQTKCTEVLDRWAQMANSWIYWSGAQLQFVPLGDSSVTGNGVTYTPHNDVAYDLTLDDLIPSGAGQAPVEVSRKDPADCYNTTSVSINDRTLGYVSRPIEYKDQTLVDLYGRRDSTSIQADDCCDPAVGQIIAQLIGKRAAYIRNTYKFRTSRLFILCLPGTVLTIPLNFTGRRVRVRVTEIECGTDGALAFTCEEFPGLVGTYVAPPVSVTAPTSSLPDQNGLPPSINPPAIVEPPASFTGGTPKIIAAASATGDWGGCNVWLSFNGTDYRQVGTITAPAVQGHLTAALSAFSGANPDTVDTLAVDCTESATPPQPVSHADADALRTLALITAPPSGSGLSQTVASTGELLAFGGVSATGSYTANLTYLQRGQYGTAASAHASGDRFTLLDPLGTGAVEVDLPTNYVGTTIYLKFSSFNRFGNAAQDLSTCVEYSYVPSGAGYGTGSGGLPAAPASVTATPQSYGANLVSWAANAAGDNVTSYQVRRAAGLSQPYSAASLVWQGASLSYSDANIAVGSGYTYFVSAVNAVGQGAHSTGVNCTATSGPVTSSSGGSIALTGAIDGTNTTFTMASAVPTGAIPLLALNGTVQSGAAYTISGTTLTMGTAPSTGSTLALSYFVLNL